MIEAIILGIVQGITEFLPVSSTAHLILFPWFFNWTGDVDTLTFDIALHAGTLLALILCFWKDWLKLVLHQQKRLGLILLASLPAGIAGLLLNDFVEHRLRNPVVICAMLIIVGIVMLVSERTPRRKGIDGISLADALAIGAAQALSIIPGVSRSGITISAGLFRGVEREAAARFSFLLSTPIIGGATLLHLQKALETKANYDFQLFAAGFVVSFLTGIIAIKFLLHYLRKYPLNLFVYYRFGLSAVIIAGIWLKG